MRLAGGGQAEADIDKKRQNGAEHTDTPVHLLAHHSSIQRPSVIGSSSHPPTLRRSASGGQLPVAPEDVG